MAPKSDGEADRGDPEGLGGRMLAEAVETSRVVTQAGSLSVTFSVAAGHSSSVIEIRLSGTGSIAVQQTSTRTVNRLQSALA